MSEPIWFAGKERWQVIWHAIRKLRWHRSIHAKIDKGAAGATGASMTIVMLIFSGRSLFLVLPRNLTVRACVLAPEKKIPRRSN